VQQLGRPSAGPSAFDGRGGGGGSIPSVSVRLRGKAAAGTSRAHGGQNGMRLVIPCA